jgi:dTDP-glucose pyrophosphorylase
MKNWQKTLVGAEASIIEVIESLNNSACQICLVVDGGGRLLGTVTDGDIRRGILKGVKLDGPASQIMNASPLTVSSRDAAQQRLALMRAKRVHHLPVLDDAGVVIGVESESDLTSAAAIPNWAVLMVGGLGERLRPLTETVPKPLLPVGGRPLLETILGQLAGYGFRRVYLAVNYLAEQFEEVFGDGSRLGLDIRYVREDGKLGTAGALSALPERPEHPMLVMNGDVLTSVNYRSLLAFHHEHRAAATLCVREHAVQVPYGVVEIDQSKVVAIQEKPSLVQFINAGIYVLEPSALDLLAPGAHCDMPTLLQRCMDKGGEVSAFPIREYWLDIGRPDDFAKANGDYHRVFGADAKP